MPRLLPASVCPRCRRFVPLGRCDVCLANDEAFVAERSCSGSTATERRHDRRHTRKHVGLRDTCEADMVCPSPAARRLIERGFRAPLYRVMEPHERVIFDAWGPCPCQPGAYLASFVIIRAGYPRTRSVFFRSTDSRRYTRRSGPTDRVRDPQRMAAKRPRPGGICSQFWY